MVIEKSIIMVSSIFICCFHWTMITAGLSRRLSLAGRKPRDSHEMYKYDLTHVWPYFQLLSP